jgi:hypothetical protein
MAMLRCEYRGGGGWQFYLYKLTAWYDVSFTDRIVESATTFLSPVASEATIDITCLQPKWVYKFAKAWIDFEIVKDSRESFIGYLKLTPAMGLPDEANLNF